MVSDAGASLYTPPLTFAIVIIIIFFFFSIFPYLFWKKTKK